MAAEFVLAILAVFVSVALAAGVIANLALSSMAPERRRLRELSNASPTAGLVLETTALTDSLGPLAKRVASFVPKSPRDLSQLRRRLTSGGYRDLAAAIWFMAVQLALPVALGAVAYVLFGISRGWMFIGFGLLVGFLLPEFWLDRQVRRRQKAIRNGLPDALDLFIVCLEAGSSLDQAILKAGDELGVAHPALAEELKLVTTEIRAGKPRIEAIKNFADRTKVADVRSLVAMLVQTDKFGTSVAQGLRTHAETSRTKRRQRAEERAAKVGVKLVFPLVFLLFPALYVVILGPVVIRFVRVFLEQVVQGP